MNAEHFQQRLSLEERAALVDAAKRRATKLRNEAIDAFWARLVQNASAAWRTIRRTAPAATLHPTRSTPPCPR